MKCPNCNKENRDGLLLCEYCGRPLVALSELSRNVTGNLGVVKKQSGEYDLPKQGTGYLHESSYVTLDLVDSNHKIYLKTQGHISIGRSDKDSNWTPTVDLAA